LGIFFKASGKSKLLTADFCWYSCKLPGDAAKFLDAPFELVGHWQR
jgi:hypothetical protein